MGAVDDQENFARSAGCTGCPRTGENVGGVLSVVKGTSAAPTPKFA